MGALLPVLLAIGVLASMMGLYSSQIGSMGVDQIMRDKQLTWSYNAAMAGLKEGILSPIATNRLNFINGPIDPYNPASGIVKNDAGDTIAMYQYFALGGDPQRNEMGAFDATRLGNLTSIHPRYVAAVGTSCISTSTHQPIASAVTVNYADGTLSCSSGEIKIVTVFAKLSMGTLVSSAVSNNPIQWIRVWAGEDDTINTEGPRVWVPDYGMISSFNFSRAWQGGTEGTPGLQAADLYKVFVKSGATVLSSTWTAYDALGQQDVYLPDSSYTTTLSETPTVKFVFSGPMYFPSLYPSSQIVAASPNVNYGGCFSDGNLATQCNIYAQKENDASPNVELEVYPVLPSGSQVMTYGSFPEYSNSSGAASDNLYSLNIRPDTVYDAWGNAASAFQALFKVGDVITGDVCSTPENVTFNSYGNTTWTGNDPNKVYNITVYTPTDASTLELNLGNGCNNTVTITTIYAVDTTINITSGSTVNLNLPAKLSSYAVSGSSPTHYQLSCPTGGAYGHDVYVTGTHTPSYGSYNCSACTPAAVSYTWYGGAVDPMYSGYGATIEPYNSTCVCNTSGSDSAYQVNPGNPGSLGLTNMPSLGTTTYTVPHPSTSNYQVAPFSQPLKIFRSKNNGSGIYGIDVHHCAHDGYSAHKRISYIFYWGSWGGLKNDSIIFNDGVALQLEYSGTPTGFCMRCHPSSPAPCDINTIDWVQDYFPTSICP